MIVIVDENSKQTKNYTQASVMHAKPRRETKMCKDCKDQAEREEKHPEETDFFGRKKNKKVKFG